jgi:protein-disulfide isomerase
MGLSRRGLLIGAGAMIGVWALKAPVQRLFAGRFEFVDLESPAGFRSFEGGQLSGGFDPFFGLEGGTRDGFAALVDDTSADLERHLYGPHADGTVRIASFSDYNCPYCRVLTKRLDEISQSDPSVRITWHELPLLGETSVIGARAALAAERQGAYLAMHKRLMRSGFRVTPAYIESVAADLGLDTDQLARDMDQPDVLAQIDRVKALAQIFGIIGTPAMVVGKTLVMGEISLPRLDALIALERSET